jgi:hypothetical protein
MIGVLIFIAVVTIILALVFPWPTGGLLLVPLSITMAAVGATFFRLTTIVTAQWVEVQFGLGWPKRQIAVSDIRSATPVQNPWYYGWGIRLTPRGWLWNVSGSHAVELELRGGNHFRIGTDQPEKLAAAINSARS